MHLPPDAVELAAAAAGEVEALGVTVFGAVVASAAVGAVLAAGFSVVVAAGLGAVVTTGTAGALDGVARGARGCLVFVGTVVASPATLGASVEATGAGAGVLALQFSMASMDERPLRTSTKSTRSTGERMAADSKVSSWVARVHCSRAEFAHGRHQFDCQMVIVNVSASKQMARGNVFY